MSTDQTIECEVINDGPQGLEKIRNGKFDLVLLDIAMPKFTGWDILQSLKNDGLVESKNIVIFTTSWINTSMKWKRRVQRGLQKTLFNS